MPAQPFSVHPDLDELTRQNIAAALTRPATGDDATESGATTHHGARDTRQEARRSSDRAHADRASGAPSGRTYAFRRS